MTKQIHPISAEYYNVHRDKFNISFSKAVAIRESGKGKLYRAPNGVYVWEKKSVWGF